MAQDVVLAVAGSGKTRLIIERLNAEDQFLIITYTDNNLTNLRARILDKYGCIPDNIRLYTYFRFLYGFCIKPILGDDVGCKGINWEPPPFFTLKLKRDKRDFYLDRSDCLYHNRMAKLLDSKENMPKVKERLKKYFDCVLIDEAQDFGGHDLNFICSFAKADFDILLVGDFYQHTFDTSKDGNTNKNIYNDYEKYLAKLVDVGFKADKKTLVKSHRCSPDVCDFIQENLDIQIESHRQDRTAIHIVDDQEKADSLFFNDDIVKLFYQEHYKYPCHSENWGKSKGQDHYNDVCVVLNPNSHKAFKGGSLKNIASASRSKLYVACTRARGDLYFVSDEFYKIHKNT